MSAGFRLSIALAIIIACNAVLGTADDDGVLTSAAVYDLQRGFLLKPARCNSKRAGNGLQLLGARTHESALDAGDRNRRSLLVTSSFTEFALGQPGNVGLAAFANDRAERL